MESIGRSNSNGHSLGASDSVDLTKRKFSDIERRDMLRASVGMALESPEVVLTMLERLAEAEKLVDEGNELQIFVSDLIGNNQKLRSILKQLVASGAVYVDMSGQQTDNLQSRSEVFITDKGIELISILRENIRLRQRTEQAEQLARQIQKQRKTIVFKILNEIKKKPGYPRGTVLAYSRFEAAITEAYNVAAQATKNLDRIEADARLAAYALLDEVKDEQKMRDKRADNLRSKKTKSTLRRRRKSA